MFPFLLTEVAKTNKEQDILKTIVLGGGYLHHATQNLEKKVLMFAQ